MVLGVLSSLTIISPRKRELGALLLMRYGCPSLLANTMCGRRERPRPKLRLLDQLDKEAFAYAISNKIVCTGPIIYYTF